MAAFVFACSILQPHWLRVSSSRCTQGGFRLRCSAQPGVAGAVLDPQLYLDVPHLWECQVADECRLGSRSSHGNTRQCLLPASHTVLLVTAVLCRQALLPRHHALQASALAHAAHCTSTIGAKDHLGLLSMQPCLALTQCLLLQALVDTRYMMGFGGLPSLTWSCSQPPIKQASC